MAGQFSWAPAIACGLTLPFLLLPDGRLRSRRCTVTSAVRVEAQCLATYVLPGGQITGQALIVLGDPAPYLVAVTGGSGKFKGVEGEIRVLPVSETRPRGVLTFHLQG